MTLSTDGDTENNGVDPRRLGMALLNAIGASRAAGHVSILGLADYLGPDSDDIELCLLRDILRECMFEGDKEASARLNAYLASSDTMRRGAEAAGRIG